MLLVANLAKHSRVNLSNAKVVFLHPKHKNAKISENHMNPVILVFIGKPTEYSQMSTNVSGFL